MSDGDNETVISTSATILFQQLCILCNNCLREKERFILCVCVVLPSTDLSKTCLLRPLGGVWHLLRCFSGDFLLARGSAVQYLECI